MYESQLFCYPQPLNAEICVYKPWRSKRFFSISNRHKVLNWIFPLHVNTYIMGLRPLLLFNMFNAWTVFWRCWAKCQNLKYTAIIHRPITYVFKWSGKNWRLWWFQIEQNHLVSMVYTKIFRQGLNRIKHPYIMQIQLNKNNNLNIKDDKHPLHRTPPSWLIIQYICAWE